jgi:hypothetical protein
LNGRWPVVLAATIGAIWGVLAYRILWGDTSIVVTREFVVSLAGLLSLLPVRIVLYAIRLAEVHVAGHPFDFADNHAWIGVTAAAVGALLLGVPVQVAAMAVRHNPRRRAIRTVRPDETGSPGARTDPARSR